MQKIDLNYGFSNVSIYPERGGLVTSVILSGTELLYQDMLSETLFDKSKSVRGGIPYMFPNAGPLTSDENAKLGTSLPQHGIVRNEGWGVLSKQDQNLELIYVSNEDSYKYFPYNFFLKNTIGLEKNTFVFSQEIKNFSEKNMPISTGLHPYFDVPLGEKTDINIYDIHQKELKIQGGDWKVGETAFCENIGNIIYLGIPGIGKIKIETSIGYKKYYIWSLPDKNFICVEPMMGNDGDIGNNPQIMLPGEVKHEFMKLSLEK